MSTNTPENLSVLPDLELTIRRQPGGYRAQFVFDHDQPFRAGTLSKDVVPWLNAATAVEDTARLQA